MEVDVADLRTIRCKRYDNKTWTNLLSFDVFMYICVLFSNCKKKCLV